MLTTTSITIIIIMMIIITIPVLIFIDIIIIIIITATTTITISKLNFALYKQMYSYKKKTTENPPVSGRTALVVIIGMATMTSPLALQTYFMRNCSS